MKNWIVLLTIVSFLPLQAAAECDMSPAGDTEASSCHSEMNRSEFMGHDQSTYKPGAEDDHSECFFCQSGLCQGLGITQEYILLSEIERQHNKAKKAQQPLLHSCSTKVIKPRLSIFGLRVKAFLSYHSWQSFFATYII